jgi:hypothetical protein
MDRNLETVLNAIGERYQAEIHPQSNLYLEVDIGREAERSGHPELREHYRGVNACVPLKQVREGMKVLIDGRTFVGYAQLTSGVVIPGFVARDCRLTHSPYRASDSMVLNFA